MAIACFTNHRAVAQSADFGNWMAYFGTGKINDKWSIWTEAQYRGYNFISDREQLLLRVAALYNINPSVSVAQGYGFISGRTYASSGKVNHTAEHRLYQQLMLKQSFGRFNIQHRYRMEERFLEDDFRVRFRYFLSANIALNKPSVRKGALYLSLYNEIFIYADRPLFDRDRIFGGAGYMFNSRLRVEAGTMTQVQETRSRGQFNIMVFHNYSL